MKREEGLEDLVGRAGGAGEGVGGGGWAERCRQIRPVCSRAGRSCSSRDYGDFLSTGAVCGCKDSPCTRSVSATCQGKLFVSWTKSLGVGG